MFKRKMFDTPEYRELLRHFPGRNRRWNVTIFRNELADGVIKSVVVHQYENVRSKGLHGNIVDDGVLCFIDADGKEVVASSVPFMHSQEISLENAMGKEFRSDSLRSLTHFICRPDPLQKLGWCLFVGSFPVGRPRIC